MTAVSVDCAYLAGPDLEFVTSGSIGIERGRITALWRGHEDAPESSSAAVLRFAGCIAVPALINAHVHLRDAIAAEAAVGQRLEQSVMGPSSTRARRLAAATSDQRIAAMHRVLQHAAQLGTAALADFCDGGLQGIAEVHAAAADVPIDVIVFGRLSAPQDAAAVRANAPLSAIQRSELDQVLELADGFATATINDYSDRAWQEIRGRTQQIGKMLAVHLAEHADQCAASLALCGRSDVERVLEIEPDHVVHLTQVSMDGLAAVERHNIPVVVCPRSNAMTGIGYPPLDELMRSQHPVALGSDNVMLNAPNLWREMEYAAKSLRAARLDPCVIDPRELLRCATVNGARALRLNGVYGSIDVDNRADFLLVANVFTCMPPNGSEVYGMLAHRLEPQDIVGRFRSGTWLPNPLYHPETTLA